jgi:hypothetical protein
MLTTTQTMTAQNPKMTCEKNAAFNYFGFNVGVTFLLSKTTLKKKEAAQ